jgi:DnaJ-class molecular chaperone
VNRVPCRACDGAGVDWRGDECLVCHGAGTVDPELARVELDADAIAVQVALPIENFGEPSS